MSKYSAQSLTVPEARECGERLFSQMISEETSRRSQIKSPTILDEIREKIAAENPNEYLVPCAMFRNYKLLAALAAANYSDVDQAPVGLVTQIEINRDALAIDTQDIEASKNPLEPFSYGVYVLRENSYVEVFAHNFEIIGKISLREYQEGEL